VSGRAGSAEVYLHGAHVTAFTPAGGAPVIFMSAKSVYENNVALRGGVPLCFPWFGANADDPTAPSHGFARLTDWELTSATEEGDDVVLAFHLTDSADTRSTVWPHRFDAVYTVTVGAHLTLALTITNNDPDDITFEEAMHTYLAVSDIHSTEVLGLEDTTFLDRLAGPASSAPEKAPVRFTGETDRIYFDATGTVTVVDPPRTITVSKSGSTNAVIWNPWSIKAAAMADFGDDEWTGMVCVEACNVREGAIRLAPGASHTMTATFASK
jgi:D-hexose-6-phosphate mutarotase